MKKIYKFIDGFMAVGFFLNAILVVLNGNFLFGSLFLFAGVAYLRLYKQYK